MCAKATKSAWFDEASKVPLIADEARRLESFMSAMADGRVDESEIREQERRVVDLMKEIEPLLDENLHGKVTQLLCELTAYDLMQVTHSIYQSRPATRFRG